MNAYAPSRTGRRRQRATFATARGIGWLSIGVGVAELLLPRVVSGVAGLRGREGMMRARGVREIVTGIGILAARRPGPWMWARVAGHAFDAVALGARSHRAGTRYATAAIAGTAMLDAGCAAALDRVERRGKLPLRNYSDRRGLPLPPNAMRGAALKDFEMPPDMATPALLAPWPPTALQS